MQERAVITSSLVIDMGANSRAIQEMVKNTEKQSLVDEIVSIYDPQRKIFVFSTEILKEEFHRKFLNAKDTSQVINNIQQKELKISVIKVKDYWVVISAKDVLEREALKDLRDILIILCLVALLFIAYISWYMADKALSPISRIVKQLDNIFPKNLSMRMEYPNAQDEIGALTKTINELLNRVENSLNTQKMFVANISHELKNPLTKIFTQIEVLEMKYKDHPDFYNQIVSLRSDTLQLNHLTQSLLELASIHSTEADLPKKATRIDELLIDSIAEFKRWNPGYSVDLNLDDFPENEDILTHLVNQDALKVVFKNLLDNAGKFSVNDRVDVKLYEANNELIISVFNEGKPIPQEEIAKVFQPFFRSDSTARGKKGHGVGLAIVKQILSIHAVNLDINTSESGNYFILRFRK